MTASPATEKPWENEPDRVEFRHAGLPCLLNRSCFTGVWCGYVGLPPGHPMHGRHYDAINAIDVHGGLTYSGPCDGAICHVPMPGESDDVWWLGFDCGHYCDLSPGLIRWLVTNDNEPGITTGRDVMRRIYVSQTYRDQAYVTKEVQSLAEQLAELNKPSEP